MDVVELSFRSRRLHNAEEAEDRLQAYLGALFQNGQILGDAQIATVRRGYLVVVNVPRADALDARTGNKWVRRTIDIVEEHLSTLAEYARVPIVFTVDRVLDVTPRADDSGRFELSERRLEVAYDKDYDAIEGEGPLHWARRLDLSHWALFAARVGTRRIGGAAVAFDTPGLTMLEGRRDLAVLWDIRVFPDVRGQGVGSALFEHVEAWARQHGCRELRVETQNTNVQACRFYERHGCQLRAIHRAVYPEFPEEIQLLWYKDLPR